MATGFTRVPHQVDFPAVDARILDLWDRIDAFQASIDMRPADRSYTFYDGPPFPTGSPHYGNLLAGVIKDVVPRYWTMRGYRVERRFGWDTHALPIEMEVEKDLGISGPRAITEFGIDKFNEACRTRVQANTETWEDITRRIGRWIDFENDYRTLDTDFMETVWWVFRQLWDKGLIYKDFKVLPYSFGATTPLSNFEANMDYRDVDDPSITVRVRVTEDHGAAKEGDSFLIWTTTPWTLPANLAIAVGEEITYARVADDLDGVAGPFWVAEDLVSFYWGDATPTITDRVPGRDLIGASYEPPFDYFGEERDRGAFRVITSPEVVTTEGTGMVHMAPAYGEADFYALQAAGLDVLVDPIDLEARFTDAVPDVAGQNVKDADAALIRLLKERGAIVRHTQLRHSYPFCWRTGTPLIYKAIPTWFVAVESFRERMAELNQTVHWVPEHVGSRRFGNWLADARDWAISRNRYWGSCIPVWECDNCDESVCVGSIEELAELSGVTLTDLHRHFVDPVTFACSSCSGTMTRVSEVLDCWFESGSMPYAEHHYPFENAETFDQRFPADFIAEGLDQTRGWFYTLVVLATALFDEAPFSNGVVNGLILDEKGEKMSKSLGNAVSPQEVIKQQGAEILRLWVSAADFQEDVKISSEILKRLVEAYRKIRNTCRYMLGNLYDFDPQTPLDASALSELDRFALSRLNRLIRRVTEAYENFTFHDVYHSIYSFCVIEMSSFYFDILKDRLYTLSADSPERRGSQAVLYRILRAVTGMMAPVLSFSAEEVYRNTPGAGESIFLEPFPEPEEDMIDEDLESRWLTIVSVRDDVNKAIEIKRGEKILGNSLEASVTIHAGGEVFDLLSSYRDDLPAILIVSDAGLAALEDAPAEAFQGEVETVRIMVRRSGGLKCQRCWNWRPDVPEGDDEEPVCGRCRQVLAS